MREPQPERCRWFRGAPAPSRVLTGALAGQSGGLLQSLHGELAGRLPVFREGAEHRTRGACAPRFNCMVPA